MRVIRAGRVVGVAWMVGMAMAMTAGCTAYEYPRAIIVDSALSAEDQDAAIQAAAEWCERVPGTCVPVAIGERSGSGVWVTRGRTEEVCEDGLWGCVDYHSDGTMTVIVDDACPDFRVCALHELGHTFQVDESAEHLPDGNVMAAVIDETLPGLTDRDVAWVLGE